MAVGVVVDEPAGGTAEDLEFDMPIVEPKKDVKVGVKDLATVGEHNATVGWLLRC
jgi:hypothetical protein